MKDLIVDFDKELDVRGLFSILSDLKGEYIVKVKKKTKGRSLQQNKYYRGVVIKEISDFTGHSTNFLHEYFKYKFIPYVKFADDYSLTTTDMTTKEISDYIEMIREWAEKFLGLKIPSPDSVIL